MKNRQLPLRGEVMASVQFRIFNWQKSTQKLVSCRQGILATPNFDQKNMS
jgi:hypothetical protein